MVIIPIYYGQRHTFTAVADRSVEVVCPDCKCAFRMEDRVGAVGTGFSVLGLQDAKASDVAYQSAMNALEKSLPQLSPVPCPQCGSFHPAMKPILRWILGQRILFIFMGIVVVLAIGGLLQLLKKAPMDEKAMLVGAGAAALVFLVYRYLKDLRLCPVKVEKLESGVGRPPLRVGIRFSEEQAYHWFNADEGAAKGLKP